MIVDYPLCLKYSAPDPGDSGAISGKELGKWIESLPDDWPSRFNETMGQVTCILLDSSTSSDDDINVGFWPCDIEDTLWALENNHKYRRWNG